VRNQILRPRFQVGLHLVGHLLLDLRTKTKPANQGTNSRTQHICSLLYDLGESTFSSPNLSRRAMEDGASFLQHLLKSFQDARISFLAEPKNGLFSNGSAGVLLCNPDERGNRFIVIALAQREDDLLLYFYIGIIFRNFL